MNEELKERGITITDMNQKEMGIINHIGHGKTTTQLIETLKNNFDVIVVDTKKDNTFTINGITYEPIHNEKINGIPLLPQFPTFSYKRPYGRKLPENIQIIKEFELIQIKCSKLSKWERNEVIRIFKLKFKELNI